MTDNDRRIKERENTCSNVGNVRSVEKLTRAGEWNGGERKVKYEQTYTVIQEQ